MKRFVFLYGIVFLLIILLHPAGAQTVRFRTITTEQGLSSNSVYSITQDKKGFIWISTSDGLNRYDGYNVRVFQNDRDDSTTVSSNLIRTSYADNKDRLWIATSGGGLNVMDLKSGRIARYLPDSRNKNSIPSVYITCIEEINGKIYLGSSDRGVFVCNPDDMSFSFLWEPKSGPVDFGVRDLLYDGNNVLWIATWGEGLLKWDLSKEKIRIFRNEGRKGSLPHDKLRALLLDKQNRLWISMWNAGVAVMDTRTEYFESGRDSSSAYFTRLPFGLVSEMLIDNKDRLWFATAERGAVMLDGYRLRFFENIPGVSGSISDNAVFSLFQDESGKIWMGTWRGGLNIYDPLQERFNFFRNNPSDSNSLHNNNVYSIREISEGNFLIGTSESVTFYKRKENTFTRLPLARNNKEALLYNSVVYCVEADPFGNLWFATSGGGLYRYSGRKNEWKNYNAGNGDGMLRSSSPSVLLFSKEELLVGTFGGGLSVYNYMDDRFTTYNAGDPSGNAISSDLIHCMHRMKDGKIWIGTDDGLSVFDQSKRQFRIFYSDPKDPASLPGSGVHAIYPAADGKVWLSTTGGLCYYEDGKGFVRMDKFHPALKREAAGIVADQKGDLWITTAKGLLRLNPQTGSSRMFTLADGLQGGEFTPGSLLMSSAGEIFAGGMGGMNVFREGDIHPDTICPAPFITSVSVRDRNYSDSVEAPYIDDLNLSWRDYFFTVYFSSPSFEEKERMQYSYLLEGFNEKWVDIGSVHHITFTNLDPGNYILRIRAVNADGVFSPDLRLPIYIRPPFWKTKWFLMLCVISALISMYLFIRYREQKLVSEKRVLEEKVGERTLELKQEKLKVEEAHKEIVDSIHYAKRIQRTLLASTNLLDRNLDDYFVLYRPKDIVSGDFYWAFERKEKNENGISFLIAACDCTGHGVPGAFMSLLNISFLNEAVSEKGLSLPNAILDETRNSVLEAFTTEDGDQNKDGMDAVLIGFNKEKNRLYAALANNPLWIIRRGELIEYKADKMPVGAHHGVLNPFSLSEIELQSGDVIYMFTDGFADQFGGPKGKKFKYSQFSSLLLEIQKHNMKEQEVILAHRLTEWKGDLEQNDDVLIIGIRV